ncbi:MAG: hypothetical protein AAGA48_17260 [Myxococcota bacterium]
MRGMMAVALLGCAVDDDIVDFTRQGEALADFSLVDENATSPTAGQAVSVSDQRGRVSAWYFGHST